MNELVSIVIAIYNGEKFLRETIDSLLNQTYKKIEIIVVVNCTNDETIKILESYEDERIKIFETNICQLAFNLNYGILQSKGKYIARIDADDIAINTRIEKQLEIIKNNNYDIVGSNIIYIDETGKEIDFKKYNENDSDIRKDVYFKSPIAHPSVMYKKDIILKNNGYLNGRVSEDYDLWIRLMRNKDIKFYNIQESLLLYRIHNNQSKGNKLAYCEVTSYMLREMLYQKSFKYFIGLIFNILKTIFK